MLQPLLAPGRWPGTGGSSDLEQRVVLRRAHQQDAQRRVFNHHVTRDLDGRRRREIDSMVVAGSHHHVLLRTSVVAMSTSPHSVGERDDAVGSVGDEVAVLRRRLTGFTAIGGKLRVGGDRDAPLMLSWKTRASHVHQRDWSMKLSISDCATGVPRRRKSTAERMVARCRRIHREAGLIDAHAAES